MIDYKLQLLSDAEMSFSVIGAGAVKKGTTPAKKKTVTIYASKNSLKQILNQLSNSKNKVIVNIIVMVNIAQNINSPGSIAAAHQGVAQDTKA